MSIQSPRSLSTAFFERNSTTEESWIQAIHIALDPAARYVDSLSFFDEKAKRRLLTDRSARALRHHDSSAEFRRLFNLPASPDRVDHLKGVLVDREVIRKEELDYHSPGTRVSEVLVGEIVLSTESELIVRANYTIRFEQTRASGAWARGFSDIELLIDFKGPSPQIIRQRAKNRNTEKGP